MSPQTPVFSSDFGYFDYVSFNLFFIWVGAQFKAIVEYAPSQRVPKHNAKRDGREGTIYKGMNN